MDINEFKHFEAEGSVLLRHRALRFTHLFLIMAVLLHSCKEDDTATGDLKMYGSGEYNFTAHPPFAERPVKCFYHIPESSTPQSPVMVVIHGAGRNGQSLRNELIANANEKNIVLLSLQFSDEYFPGTNAFNLASIFDNGENPTPESLRPPDVWTFQVIDPLFRDFRTRSGSIVSRYDIAGHSAGAQLVHRFMQFEPEASFNRLVTSAAGWYMLPDSNVNFPYGQGLSPAAAVDPALCFGRYVFVVVGAADTDPNSFNLRHTPEADAQGNNRVERAQYFYNTSLQLAENGGHTFSWQYHAAEGVGHDDVAMLKFAITLLYN